MPTHDSEAIVLRQYSLSEADRIVVLFTQDYGKIRAVAQGVKRLKSRLGGCLEPLNHIQVHFYLKQGGELARIRQCDTIHCYLGREPSLERVFAFSYMAELTQELIQENYPNDRFFRLFLSAMRTGEELGTTERLVRYFEFWALKLSGLLPDYGSCSGCGRCVKEDGFFAWPETGQGQCRTCAQGKGVFIRSGAAHLLSKMSTLSPAQFALLPWEEAAARDLERLSQRLLELHLEKRLKSYALLRQIFHGIEP